MMTPGGGGHGGGDADKYKNSKDAKHLLDQIGEDIYKRAKNDANDFRDYLKGNLQEAKGMRERVSSIETCALVKQYYEHFNGDANSNRYPCKELSGKMFENPFSDTLGGQCTNEKMRSGGKGACAPYRRLHLCHHNLETIDTTSTTSDTLLAEVCYAAKEEGNSINTHYPKHEQTNKDSASQLCTVLARSFADIGDIVRGKDLFYGNTHESAQRIILENNLKTIFKKIHDDVTTNGKKSAEELKKRYQKDGDNYFQLREDWWYANRATVWEAITCNDDNKLAGASYFRTTCGDKKGPSVAKDHCRCEGANVVPTYFDYVPQYLRWFEEWAEDFCRKRKHKLKDSIEKCRKGEDGKEKYCDLNRHDCVKTIRGDHDFVEDDECHKCSVACAGFVKWIDNQKLEFLKQKKKYDKEIKKANGKNGTSITIGKTTINNIYAKEFYKKLKQAQYKDVEKFLKKLSNEGICQKPPEVGNEKADNVDFTKDETNGTFYRTKYCEACPWCGVKKQNGKGKWEAKDYRDCNPGKDYTKYKHTEIPILTPDKSQSGILKKYNKFCDSVNGKNGAPGTAPGKNGNQIVTWTCYYKKNENRDGKKDFNFCVLQDKKTGTSEEKSMHYNSFFWDWVYHMLHDSVEWRNELGSCIDNAKSQNCKNNKCNRECGCFLKWVVKKKEEWGKIIEHFYKQENIEAGLHDITLEFLLKKEELLKIIEGTYGNAKELEGINKILDEEEKNTQEADGGSGTGGPPAGKKKTLMDKLLNHEERIATKCQKDCQEPQKPQEQEREDPGRSAVTSRDTPPLAGGGGGHPSSDDDQEEDDEDDAEEEEEEENVEEQPPAVEDQEEKEEKPKKEETTPSLDVCETVKSALTNNDNLNEACTLKYNKGKNYGWRCVPSGSTPESGKSDGSICVPPRRRRLYVGKLEQWAKKQSSQESGDKATEGSKSQGDAASQSQSSSVSETHSQSSSSSSSPPSNPRAGDAALRDAFIQTAAIETFFLWHRYKKIKEKEEKEKQEADEIVARTPTEDTEQKQLNEGNIPEEFKRQMFYTLGDYRDICVGVKDDDVIKALKDSGDKNIDTITNKIKEILNGEKKQPEKENSDKRKTWWDKNVESIWNGMICALTYDTNTTSGDKHTLKQNKSLKEKLWDESTKKPKKPQYQYQTAKLEEEYSGEKKTNDDPLNNPKLKNFVERPPYFRYLEEWGQNFCKERKKRLEKIYKDCRGGENTTRYSSGDGEDCTQMLRDDPSTFHSIEYPGCATSCSSYRKWIKGKRKEYDEQQNAYNEQKNSYQSQHNGSGPNKDDNEFYTKLETCSKAGDFLENIKDGPCTKNNNGGNNINFNNTDDTFKHAENCNPCSEFKIKCENGVCNGDGKKVNCNGGKISAENINNSTVIDMLVSDDGTKKFEGDLEPCGSAGIFQGIRKDEWTCEKVCGYVVCKPKKVNGETVTKEKDNGKHIVQIRALLRLWLEYFLEDYKKIKHKISHCTKTDQRSTCIKGCVEKWVEEKRKEWENIKKRFLEQYKNNEQNDYNMRSFLEELIPQMNLVNDKGKVTKLSQLFA
ncbi:hypothetical protein PFBG_02052 [Plasmodium falciparum 7G8]|uniref:Erythrocyte membrane protein 1 n=1 Tax=Plasmodium falciparum (isolate 7G8) TaxID=57266 RepID=W7F9V8_PLAF8|nr:hypothetical protein PFBG_02052 [Plasmodium falciparum 7G8]